MIVKQCFMEPFISYGKHHPALGKKHTHSQYNQVFSPHTLLALAKVMCYVVHEHTSTFATYLN